VGDALPSSTQEVIVRLPLRSLLVVLIALAIAQVPTHVGAEKYTKYTVVPLRVTVEPNLSDNVTPSKITSDGMGDYVDGQDGVEANLDQWGNLIIDFQTKRTPLRWLNYTYTPALGGYGDFRGNYLSTIRGGPIQLMTPGESQCVQAAITRSGDSSIQLWHYFGRPVGGYDNSDTSSLSVTRVDGSTWEIETSTCGTGVFGGVTRVFEVETKGNNPLNPLGLYGLPFRMTLTAK
jgi:hypothetical protein